MAIITDVEKLRPELKSVSDAELERRMTELRMEMERREKEAKRAKVEHVVPKPMSICKTSLQACGSLTNTACSPTT